MTTDEAIAWMKANPDRVLHRSTGEGPCKEAELEALLDEALGLLAVELRAHGMGCDCPPLAFLNRPDVKRFLDG